MKQVLLMLQSKICSTLGSSYDLFDGADGSGGIQRGSRDALFKMPRQSWPQFHLHHYQVSESDLNFACPITPTPPLVVQGTHWVVVVTEKGGVLVEKEDQVGGCKLTVWQTFLSFL